MIEQTALGKMKTRLWPILILAFFLGLGAGCASLLPVNSELANDVKECHPFRTEPFLSALVLLQGMSPYAAEMQLRRLALNEHEHDLTVMLCRALFTAKSGETFRPPYYYYVASMGGIRSNDPWPNSPIALVNNVPFVIYAEVDEITAGDISRKRDFTELVAYPADLSTNAPRRFDTYGVNRKVLLQTAITAYAPIVPSLPSEVERTSWPESAKDYIDYCLKKAQWTSVRYKVVDQAAMAAALQQLIQSPKWKRALNDDEIRFLSYQITDGKTAPPPMPIFSEFVLPNQPIAVPK